jgi:hypothetical protein
MLEKDYKKLSEEINESMSLLQVRIKALLKAQKNLTYQHVILWKRCQWLKAAKRRLKKQIYKRAISYPSTFYMM